MVLKRTFILKIIIAIMAIVSVSCQKQNEVDLSGRWFYRLDPQEEGVDAQWYDTTFDKVIELPAALRDYAIGEKPSLSTDWTGSIYDSTFYFNPEWSVYRDSLWFPFWLTPTTHYKGMAWYQRPIFIPQDWKNKRIDLCFERPHWQTKVWIDSVFIGECNSLSVPHRFSFSTHDIPTGEHRLTVMVDNAIREVDPGINSHSITDHTQGNWNGIVGKMKMHPTSENSIDQIKITPNTQDSSIWLTLKMNNVVAPYPNKLCLSISGVNFDYKYPLREYKIKSGDNLIRLKINLGRNAQLWSEFSPNLYQIDVSVLVGANVCDSRTLCFGLRQFSIQDKRFAINGVKTYLRGTTECCVFPKTGYPPTDVPSWDSIFAVCKSFGLNHIRFHSYCPPEAAFTAADKAGFYLQVEGPSWAKYSTSLGYGRPIDQYLIDESKRIVDEYGNHPSFVMMAYGNEPSGRYVDYLNNWVDTMRNYDARILYTGASTGGSWHILENSDFIVRAKPRGLAWNSKQPESMFDYRHKTEGLAQPYVTFEMGQWCVFPDFDEIEKYTGVLKAKNFELFQEELSKKGMAGQAHDFLMASGKLQASCYKQEIEATMRTPNLAGFQLLSLNDFSGQGTALVGVLNAFWQEKGYVTADEFHHFCNEVVPLVRLPKFVFHSTDTLRAEVEVANFSGEMLNKCPISWQLVDEKQHVVGAEEWSVEDIEVGLDKLGTIVFSLEDVTRASKLRLVVKTGDYSNEWSVWVYPQEKKEVATQLYVCSSLNEDAINHLNNGEKVLLLADKTAKNGGDVVTYQTPVFWNTSWFRMRPPHTTGLLIEDKHPLFKNFPTDYYTDHQWWELANRSNVMNLSDFQNGFKPIVQPIDTWFVNRKLGLLFEAKVGNGKLLVVSMDIQNNLKHRPVAMRLHNAIVEYMNSDDFTPQQEVSIEQIEALFAAPMHPVFDPMVKGAP